MGESDSADAGGLNGVPLSERWAAIVAHRAMLLRIAQSRSSCKSDAEEAVQEAMCRVAHFDGLDESRLEALLVSTTTRLCTDEHRRAARDRRLAGKLGVTQLTVPPPDDDVCDAALGRWAMDRLPMLARRERAVFDLRASGASMAETMAELGLTYKAVEAAFTRARSKMRAALKSAIGVLGLIGWRTGSRSSAAVPVAASATLVLIATAIVAVAPGMVHRPSAEPPRRAAAESVQVLPVRRAATAQVHVTKARPAKRVNNAPRRSDQSAEQILSPSPTRVGPVEDSGTGVSRRHQDEDLPETLQRCVDKGVEVSPNRIGCRE